MKNRNELSKLYPDAKNKSEITAISDTSTRALATDVKLTIWQIISVTTLLFIPIVILVLFANSLNNNIDILILNPSSLVISLWIPLILLIGVLVMTIAKISNILSETNIDSRLFLIVLYMWLLPVSQLIYNLNQHFNNNTVYPIIYSLILLPATLAIVLIIMWLMNSKIKTSKAQNILFIFSIILCTLVTIINSFIK